MRKEVKRAFQSITVFVLLMIIGTSSVNAASKTATLWVPTYGQEKENWCWNGSTQMVGHYLYEYKTQSNISRAIYGNVNDIGRLSLTVVNAVNYATGYGHNYVVVLGGHLGYWRYATSIDNGKPYLLGLQKGLGGHMVVGRGYKWNDQKNEYFLYINDPSPIKKGSTKYVNYAKFSSREESGYIGYNIFDNIVAKGKY